MTVDLIIGRAALKGRRIRVDPAHSYLSDMRQSPFPRKDEVQILGILPIERKNQ